MLLWLIEVLLLGEVRQRLRHGGVGLRHGGVGLHQGEALHGVVTRQNVAIMARGVVFFFFPLRSSSPASEAVGSKVHPESVNLVVKLGSRLNLIR